MRHQMQRPKLARLIDIAEKREAYQQQVSGTLSSLQVAMQEILELPDAPALQNKGIAAADLLVLIRSLVDAAGEREEGESDALVERVEGAVWGYLQTSSASEQHKKNRPASPVRRPPGR
jgi:hypothetical protein